MYKKYTQQLSDHFNGLNHSQFLESSKKLILSSKLNREFNPKEDQKIDSDYKNYSKYQESLNKVKRQVIYDGDENYHKNMMKFIYGLNNDVVEKLQLMDAIDDMQDPDKAVTDEQTMEEIRTIPQFDLDIPGYLSDQKTDQDDSDTQEKIESHINQMFEHQGRLSPEAKESIYSLFLQGWNVRDISMRYGILPERTKAVIWCKQYYYDEILPRIDLQTVALGLEREKMYNEWFPFVDYGIDLEDLHDREKGILQQHWHADCRELRPLDLQAKQITQKVPQKVSEVIVDGFYGKGNRGYLIKTQNIYKGKANCNRLSKKFVEIIHAGNDHYKLTKRVQDKLKLGPRIASRGYGFK